MAIEGNAQATEKEVIDAVQKMAREGDRDKMTTRTVTTDIVKMFGERLGPIAERIKVVVRNQLNAYLESESLGNEGGATEEKPSEVVKDIHSSEKVTEKFTNASPYTIGNTNASAQTENSAAAAANAAAGAEVAKEEKMAIDVSLKKSGMEEMAMDNKKEVAEGEKKDGAEEAKEGNKEDAAENMDVTGDTKKYVTEKETGESKKEYKDVAMYEKKADETGDVKMEKKDDEGAEEGDGDDDSKEDKDDSDFKAEDEEEEVAPVKKKRGRGRPRKNPVMEKDDEDGAEDVPAKKKRGRGRPRKKPKAESDDSGDEEEVKPKRRRKSSTSKAAKELSPMEKQLKKYMKLCRDLGCSFPPIRFRGITDVKTKRDMVVTYLEEKGVDVTKDNLTQSSVRTLRKKFADEKELAALDTANIISAEGRPKRRRASSNVSYRDKPEEEEEVPEEGEKPPPEPEAEEDSDSEGYVAEGAASEDDDIVDED